MKKVLILCTGNSCRSQMAAAFLREAAPNTTVCSAGTKPTEKVNSGAIKYMREIGIDLSNEKTKKVDIYLDEPWDYVITVCGGANENCPAFMGKVIKRLHMGYEDPSVLKGSEEFIANSFRSVRDKIKKDFNEFAFKESLS